ncbi:aminoacyl-tRNA hydrolase [Nesterenkonia xinjiangensis]|uniref:Peptidyl-tRNA hydrolase n=1 Tax=Nesterenkonia xinjiangensis TaxID=225327 RepID=A0A7Z0K968_9MICC|nr:aminoacyl-tRNA hydrolase [Nesterenkonia xinjiangensis]NYJ76910.1 PTH1 family peptidyl-tRNA hydrolase [Nesterenkonia xinjiangensis]
MASDTWLIAGLGNPGSRYRHTRHNIGHMVLDELVDRMDAKYTRTKVGAQVVAARLGLGGPKVVLAVSEGYMNTSGKPIRGLVDYFDVDPARLVVVHDEVDLDFGRIKLKRGGSEGGHNGLKSITQHLRGDRDYIRVRVGVSRPPGRMETADYVLQKFSPDQADELPQLVQRAADAVELIITEGLTGAQNTVHQA